MLSSEVEIRPWLENSRHKLDNKTAMTKRAALKKIPVIGMTGKIPSTSKNKEKPSRSLRRNKQKLRRLTDQRKRRRRARKRRREPILPVVMCSTLSMKETTMTEPATTQAASDPKWATTTVLSQLKTFPGTRKARDPTFQRQESTMTTQLLTTSTRSST